MTSLKDIFNKSFEDHKARVEKLLKIHESIKQQIGLLQRENQELSAQIKSLENNNSTQLKTIENLMNDRQKLDDRISALQQLSEEIMGYNLH